MDCRIGTRSLLAHARLGGRNRRQFLAGERTVIRGVVEKWHPDWAERLEKAGGNELVEYMANGLKSLTKSTDKFIKFSLSFMPPTPEKRAPFSTHSWEVKDLTKSLKMIYKNRSESLHGGVPFPGAMSYAPMDYDGAWTETPLGIASVSDGGTWIAKDVPMNLNCYEYIVRNCLLNWWRSLGIPRNQS